MKRVITAATILKTKEVVMEFVSYSEAVSFCEENELPLTCIEETGSEYLVHCKEYGKEQISNYHYSFDVYKKFGTRKSEYVSSVNDYTSACSDYTSLNKEFIKKYNMPSYFFISRPSLKIVDKSVEYIFDHYGV